MKTKTSGKPKPNHPWKIMDRRSGVRHGYKPKHPQAAKGRSLESLGKFYADK